MLKSHYRVPAVMPLTPGVTVFQREGSYTIKLREVPKAYITKLFFERKIMALLMTRGIVKTYKIQQWIIRSQVLM